MKKITITLKELFAICNMDNVGYDEFKNISEEILVQTPESDWTPILGLIKKTDDKLIVEFSGEKSFICGSRHIVQSSKGLVFIKDAVDVYNVISNSFEVVLNTTEVGEGEVFDISIDAPHLYVTPNGFVHHNTTIAKALCDEIGAEYLMINGSDEGRSIDTLRTTIRSFASTVSLTDARKIVIIDEADYTNAQSVQPALRGFIEEFSSNCRFILTCNFKNRIIEPLHSRCTCIDFRLDTKDKQQIAASFFKRAATILKSENVEFDPKVVAELVTKHFPDYRRILNELQRYSVSGKIDAGILVNASDETFTSLLKMMKEKNFTEVRKWVGVNIDIDSTELFRKLYDKSVEYIEVTSIPQLVLILADYGYKNAFVTDREINIMAAMTEIMSSCSFK